MEDTIDVHPATAAFPSATDSELRVMVHSIRAVGLLHPIVLDPEGRVLDGRTRLRACRAAGVKPRFTTYAGQDCTAYVQTVNRHRRGLTKSQQAMLAVQADTSGSSCAALGAASGVSKASISKAGTVRRHDPALAQGVASGAISLHRAYDLARHDGDTPAPMPEPLNTGEGTVTAKAGGAPAMSAACRAACCCRPSATAVHHGCPVTPGVSSGPTRHEEALRLLADIHEAFAQAGDPVLPTMRLLDLLRSDPDGHWAAYGSRGTGLTPRYLQMLLRDFGISSKNFRFEGGRQAKGFARAQFAGAWTRHCPGLPTADAPVTGRVAGGPPLEPAQRVGAVRGSASPVPVRPQTSEQDRRVSPGEPSGAAGADRVNPSTPTAAPGRPPGAAPGLFRRGRRAPRHAKRKRGALARRLLRGWA